MISAVAAVSLFLSLLVPPPAQPGVVIDVVKVNGSGCRKQTVAVALSPDGQAFTVTYSEYLARVGVGAKPNDYRKDCKITVRVDIPTGMTYAIEQVDYRGFGMLEPGATGTQRASYQFQTQPRPMPHDHDFRGPFDDIWHTTDLTDPADRSWSPCGKSRKLNIDTELRVAAGSSDPTTTTSMLGLDSLDGSIRTTYRFIWQTC